MRTPWKPSLNKKVRSWELSIKTSFWIEAAEMQTERPDQMGIFRNQPNYLNRYRLEIIVPLGQKFSASTFGCLLVQLHKFMKYQMSEIADLEL